MRVPVVNVARADIEKEIASSLGAGAEDVEGNYAESIEELLAAKTPKEAFLALQADSVPMQELLSDETLARIVGQLRAADEPLDRGRAKVLESYAPFCHGTNSYYADLIAEQGLRPRLEMGKEFTSNYEMEIISFPDRAYLGISDVEGVRKCVQAAFHASEDGENPVLLFFDGRVADLDLVADEDCQDEEWSRDALESVNLCSSVAVREAVPPEFIIDSVDLSSDDVEVTKAICRNVFGLTRADIETVMKYIGRERWEQMDEKDSEFMECYNAVWDIVRDARKGE